MRRIFRPKRDANGEWGRLHNEELHNGFRSFKIVRVIKSRNLRWAGDTEWKKSIVSKF
jgi:hypothetical protein